MTDPIEDALNEAEGAAEEVVETTEEQKALAEKIEKAHKADELKAIAAELEVDYQNKETASLTLAIKHGGKFDDEGKYVTEKEAAAEKAKEGRAQAKHAADTKAAAKEAEAKNKAVAEENQKAAKSSNPEVSEEALAAAKAQLLEEEQAEAEKAEQERIKAENDRLNQQSAQRAKVRKKYAGVIEEVESICAGKANVVVELDEGLVLKKPNGQAEYVNLQGSDPRVITNFARRFVA